MTDLTSRSGGGRIEPSIRHGSDFTAAQRLRSRPRQPPRPRGLVLSATVQPMSAAWPDPTWLERTSDPSEVRLLIAIGCAGGWFETAEAKRSAAQMLLDAGVDPDGVRELWPLLEPYLPA